MRKTFTFMIMLLLLVAASAQSVTLTFTGRGASNMYVPLNRVVVSNLTKGWQETLTWPDTVLVMSATGIGDVETFQETSLKLSQNTPNPFNGTTFVNLQVAEPGDVTIEITDITGRIIGANNYSSLQPGAHEICITLSTMGVYFLTARQNGWIVSVKMMNYGNAGENAITYVGDVEKQVFSSLQKNKVCRGVTDNPFDPGDQMEYVGFATYNNTEEESGHVVQVQDASQMVVLAFGDGAPCSGTPTLTDIDGNVYNTVQIGNQCWMRENLRTTHNSDGTVINAGSSSTVSYIDPYYYNYSGHGLTLERRGYLYNWLAAMWACPTGWHLPSDMEWTQLTDYVGGEGEFICDSNSSYVAKALASRLLWQTNTSNCAVGNELTINNASGFEVFPAGWLYYGFDYAGEEARFWSSTQPSDHDAYYRYLSFDLPDVKRGVHYAYLGFSVRCLRD